jgi:GMP synthase (glutamine-hydrolysing)
VRLLAVVHGPTVRPEVFGDVVAEEGHELVEWEISSGASRPAGAFDAVLVFGGKQNVGEEERYPWLEQEYALLREWVDEEVPLFGVCLGAQTLANALGAHVDRVRPAPLAGFYETELTEEGAADPVLGVLPRRFEALNANGYRFALPEHAVELARGQVTQAFRAGERAWAVQFHPEVRRDQALGWFAEDRPLPKPLPELERDLDEKLPAWQEQGRRLCRAFLAAA